MANINTLEEYLQYLEPVSIEDVQKIKKKIGDNIEDDYVFYKISFATIFIHEDRWLQGRYNKDLDLISDKMSGIKQAYGLNQNEDFKLNEAPLEYQKLNNEYDKILRVKLILLFQEYGLPKFAEYLEKDCSGFYERLEKIRCSKIESKGSALLDLMSQFETEANQCKNIGAYNAASIMLGAAIESILLFLCTKNIRFFQILGEENKLRKEKNQKSLKANNLSLSQLLKYTRKLKLDLFPDDEFKVLSDIAANIRNLIHPGRRLKTMIISLSSNDFQSLSHIYDLLKCSLIKSDNPTK